MTRRAATTCVLADHSKFDRPSLTVYAPWANTVTLISDQKPAGDLAEALSEGGAKVVIA
jgi:DeoR/GlpR family transcriptional regulator of sugar metabolism